MVLPCPGTWHLDQKTSKGNFHSNDSCWEPVDFHGKTGKAVEGSSSERWNKTRSLFLPLNSYFSFFFNKFLINMYKESQHMKFLLQKREAPSSQDQEPPGAPGTLSTGPALALVRGKPAQWPCWSYIPVVLDQQNARNWAFPACHSLSNAPGETREFAVASGLTRTGRVLW